MHNQYLFKSPSIESKSMITADYYYPDWVCLVDFFCNVGLKNCWQKLLRIEFKTLDISSQSSACDPSAMANTVQQSYPLGELVKNVIWRIVNLVKCQFVDTWFGQSSWPRFNISIAPLTLDFTTSSQAHP